METKAGHRDKASLFRTVPLKAGRLESMLISEPHTNWEIFQMDSWDKKLDCTKTIIRQLKCTTILNNIMENSVHFTTIVCCLCLCLHFL